MIGRFYKNTSDLPQEPGLYETGYGQVWELDDEGFWSEIHGDSAEFADHELYRLVRKK